MNSIKNYNHTSITKVIGDSSITKLYFGKNKEISSREKTLKKGNISFDKLILAGNSSTNMLLSTSFDDVFNKNDVNNFINQVNKALRPIHSNTKFNNTEVNLKSNYFMYGLPLEGNITDQNTTVKVTKDGRIQISHAELKDLLIDKSQLNSSEWNESIWKENIYNQIPVIRDLPIPKAIPLPGRDNITNRDIISGGARFLDPWPQSSWEKTSLGKSWPPDPYTTKGPLKLQSEKTNQAILLDTNHPSCINVGKTYGVKPRALITVNRVDSSVIMAVQQENVNQNPLISLAPWIIAPVKTYADRKTIAAFPVNNTVKESITSPQEGNLPAWLNAIKGNDKWQVDKENDFILINPSAEGQQSKLNTANTNWAVYAIEGSDKVIIIRSLYDHPDQFQAFVRKPDASEKSEYLELEFTGPKVTPGNKSTVVIKWEFIPVSSLSDGRFSKFGETGNMNNEVIEISKHLKELLK